MWSSNNPINPPKKSNPNYKWAKDLTRHFSKKKYKWYMKKWSILLRIKEMQIKITTRYLFPPVRMAKRQKMSVCEGLWDSHWWWECKWYGD
jgi:hypothetical protein